MRSPATSTINLIMGPGVWLMLIALSILLGGSFFFVGVAVQELPPLTIVLLHVSLAGFVLWLIVFIAGIPRPETPGAAGRRRGCIRLWPGQQAFVAGGHHQAR